MEQQPLLLGALPQTSSPHQGTVLTTQDFSDCSQRPELLACSGNGGQMARNFLLCLSMAPLRRAPGGKCVPTLSSTTAAWVEAQSKSIN